jgi:hypothetical protein
LFNIYLPCNFEVNLITHLGVIALFSSIFFFILILFVLYFKNYLEIDVKFIAKMFEEISIFSNGGHLGYRTVLTDTILKGDHLRIISAKFG